MGYEFIATILVIVVFLQSAVNTWLAYELKTHKAHIEALYMELDKEGDNDGSL